jgi:tetratricopeptide (TPR) repeat protein
MTAYDKMEEVASRIARLIIIYDPYFEEDAWHGREISRRLPNTVPLLLPFCAHPATEFLQAAGMLQDLVLTVVKSGDVPTNFARLRREGRRRSSTYWRWLGSRLLDRKNWQGAIVAAEQSKSLDPGRAQVWKMLAIALNATEQHSRAREAVSQALRIAPNSLEIQRLEAALYKHVSA